MTYHQAAIANKIIAPQFKVIDVSSRLRLAIRSSMLYKIENFECGKNFIQMIEKYGDEIAALPLHF